MQPLSFYILQLLAAIIMTALIWTALRVLSAAQLWRTIAGNIAVFFAYYFSWTGCLYLLYNYGPGGPSASNVTHRSFRDIVYWSWFDIARYVVIVAAYYVLQFYFRYRKAEKERILLSVINKDMQLNLLKQQLSPHFYFNTLNNLYGLSRANDARLPAALAQLSSIMQYVISDCNKTKVMLSQEINFLQSYIELERLRYEEDTPIEMKVSGKANGQAILPLILIQFVENAFKHGMKEKSERSWLKVKVDVKDKNLEFRVENSFYGDTDSQGIGIRSVKHILDLQYKEKHKLEMNHGDNSFSVTLKLNLS